MEKESGRKESDCPLLAVPPDPSLNVIAEDDRRFLQRETGNELAFLVLGLDSDAAHGRGRGGK